MSDQVLCSPFKTGPSLRLLVKNFKENTYDTGNSYLNQTSIVNSDNVQRANMSMIRVNKTQRRTSEAICKAGSLEAWVYF